MRRKFPLPVTLLGVFILAGLLQACSTPLPAPTNTLAPPANTSTAVIAPSATETTAATPTRTPTRLPPALPVAASPQLARISFQDENNGWGIATNEGGRLLRTVDGGSTWLDATPAGMGSLGPSAVLTVLNPEYAWALVPGTDFFAGTLYRTSDGGVHWNSNPVPFGAAFIQFLDENHGRALAERGAAAGSEAVELFQTSDGGATWNSVFHDDPNQPGSSDSLPLAGIKNSLTFLDANTGWVTGSSPAAGQVYLYATHDGGATWSQQSLALPGGYPAYQLVAQAPVFFGQAGFLPLRVYLPGRVELTFYISHDGGQTWSGNAADSQPAIPPGIIAFADARSAWSWDGGPKLYSTTDGTETWQAANPNLDLSGSLSQLVFVPASAGGFTGWALTRTDEAGHSQLYRTRDATNWTLLTP